MILLAIISLGSYCQKTDTICVPREDLKKALIKIEQGRVDAAELIQVKGQNTALQGIVSGKDNVIASLTNERNNLIGQVGTFQQLISNNQSQILLQDKTINNLNKELKKQRTKTVAVGMLAFVTFFGLIFSLK